MIKQKTKINTLRGNALSQAMTEIIEYYCDLKISGSPELVKLSIRGAKIFSAKNYQNKKLSQSELVSRVKNYTFEISNYYNISPDIVFAELNKPENNLHKKFNSRLFLYFTTTNKVITGKMMNAILTGNMDSIGKLADQVEKKNEVVLQQRKSFSESIKNMVEARNERGRKILEEKKSNSKTKRPKILLPNKSSKDTSFEYIADKLLSDSEIIINCPNDLNKYYDNQSGLENTPENLAEIFRIYRKNKEYYKRIGIEPELAISIKLLGKTLSKKGVQIHNNQHASKLIKDSLNINIITNDMIRIFYTNVEV